MDFKKQTVLCHCICAVHIPPIHVLNDTQFSGSGGERLGGGGVVVVEGGGG